ncbi:MAG: hypothetical protein NVS1B7_6890 [Candidatus Saccharimonadales bacterium]
MSLEINCLDRPSLPTNNPLNVFQKVAAATHDIITPANGLDALGFAASIYDIQQLDSLKGIAVAGAGFMTDFFDGKIARATGTQSKLGEAIDAGGDKIKLALALRKVWQSELAPRPLIAAVALQNSVNVALTSVDQLRRADTVLHPSNFGKKAIFMQQWGLGLHVFGSEVAKHNESRGNRIKLAGSVLTAAGVVVGLVASAGYVKVLLDQ